MTVNTQTPAESLSRKVSPPSVEAKLPRYYTFLTGRNAGGSREGSVCEDHTMSSGVSQAGILGR
jgi:hypothetical protein